ncbi:hypothetical protein [Bosea vaviloviae]|nr:hypothetical protein [Bosea vaviloviae]
MSGPYSYAAMLGLQAQTLFRHCEERSDEAIQGDIERAIWIASLRSQ